MRQPSLFDVQPKSPTPDDAAIVLHALGDFQSRGKVLAERELPLDRLRGALRRAAEAYGVDELDDERAVAALQDLGAQVKRVPSFFAKHPYRVTVPKELAERARRAYEELAATRKRA
ncbi:hypothetical protein [Pyrinomonas methylaliphatogenes]|jgi:hypothetical protein|uniref:Uncharacterized protein n=1 Tax=Pyrinomonas methylaliphatogenes TaxID=454194 RepID=A0A0B6WXT9_9BACT|nr:hypothetical protein [Pyrinomonas methylaliphatogenes]MBX5479308.1 hypothetical protein [Pyrinomonas methylaliphatogenes]CDM65931.1 hypothetical protein PYK22_01940 [Pyrinomonas methylaliphatogenes]